MFVSYRCWYVSTSTVIRCLMNWLVYSSRLRNLSKKTSIKQILALFIFRHRYRFIHCIFRGIGRSISDQFQIFSFPKTRLCINEHERLESFIYWDDTWYLSSRSFLIRKKSRQNKPKQKKSAFFISNRRPRALQTVPWLVPWCGLFHFSTPITKSPHFFQSSFFHFTV